MYAAVNSCLAGFFIFRWNFHGGGITLVLFGIGLDLIETVRIKNVIERTGDRFLERVYTAGEQSYCRTRRDPYPCFAARFAAKEAVLKALGTGLAGSRWTDVEIVVGRSGKPEAVLRGGAAHTASQLGVGRVLVSITHSRSCAAAMAVALVKEVGK